MFILIWASSLHRFTICMEMRGRTLLLVIVIFFYMSHFSAHADVACRQIFEKSSLNTTFTISDKEEIYQTLLSKRGLSRAPRRGFDYIWVQLQWLLKFIPSLEARLFKERQEGSTFSIGNRYGSGLSLDQNQFHLFIEQWMDQLDQRLKPYEVQSPSVHLTLARSHLKQALGEIEKAKSLPNSERGAFLSAMSKSVDMLAATSFIMKLALSHPRVEAAFESQEADRVLNIFYELENHLNEFLPSEVQWTNSELAIVVKTALENPENSLTPIFQPMLINDHTGKEATLMPAPGGMVFTPVRQRIMSVFKGLGETDSVGECVGGACSSYRSLTPERWATSLLEDSFFYDVTSNGRYIGFLQIIPVSVNGKIYGSIELQFAGTQHPLLLAEIFKNLHIQTQNKNWDGLILSESSSMSSTIVSQRILWSTPYFLLGKTVGTREDVTLLDSIAQDIIKYSPHKGHALRHGGKMIFDAGITDAGYLTRLNFDFITSLKTLLFQSERLANISNKGERHLQGVIDYLNSGVYSLEEKKQMQVSILSAYAQQKINAESTVRLLIGTGLSEQQLPQRELGLAYYRWQNTTHQQNIINKLRTYFWNAHGRIMSWF